MTSREERWNFLPIEKKHKRDTFDCGYRVLNDYLKKYARQNHQKGIAKTFVAIPSSGGLKVDGYYTISASAIEFESLPQSYQQALPAYPIPAALISKLALDNPVKEQSLGGELLADALYRIVRTSEEIEIFAVRVDAIDDKAKEFYLKHEFILFQEQKLALFLPLETIARELM